MSGIAQKVAADQASAAAHSLREKLSYVAAEQTYVGELWSIGYEEAIVMVHDRHRQRVHGIPNQSFLVATRLRAGVDPKPPVDDNGSPMNDQVPYDYEDSTLVLLRVIDSAPLPNAQEQERIRAQAGQRAVGPSQPFWDDSRVMDAYTANELSFSGVRCRVIGTFYLERQQGKNVEDVVLRFGSDLSNFYPNLGMKVYKPRDKALDMIVNFRDLRRAGDHPLRDKKVPIGHVRYASTNRLQSGVGSVQMWIAPTDLLGQKTALFGMTRTGKSNTTKIIAKSIFELRFDDPTRGRVGQIIFDYNGEYANENVQDQSGGDVPTALKNVWKIHKDGLEADIMTFGTQRHPRDPGRQMMAINFYEESMLQIGKEIIDGAIEPERGNSRFLGNFLDVVFEPPAPGDQSAKIRYDRALLAYRSLLHRAGLASPSNLRPKVNGLFSKDLITALQTSKDDADGSHAEAARHLANGATPTWDQLANAMAGLRDFIRRGQKTGFNDFNTAYINKPGGSGDRWNDARLDNILGMYDYPNGPRMIGRIAERHTPQLNRDYAEVIYEHLASGRLVIVDQSQGNELLNRKAAERIMRFILTENQKRFSRAEDPPEILVYAEEAHNLLPQSSEDDLTDVWVRTAKEGAKLKIGLLYITQEVSSIQRNILKNTSNWFIGHLNNTDETRELTKYYDFKDFEPSIRKAQDQGFLRVKTISNMYVVPAQIAEFRI